MPYQGETVRVSTTIADFDENALTNTDVDSVAATFYDSAGAVAQGPETMAWDATELYWYYDWDTSAIAAGSYRIKIVVTAGSVENWEYARLKLKTNPV